ncbi:MAG: hypothetical protein AVO35_07185 [Candidatus Aegiribacteria sp. MLS_C]|nr:MAG: hypothetical protein AVO35_07185 [Candidatus Aegiribacteria sp. MLS_C]
MGSLPHIAVVNGPSIGKLGTRQPGIYGTTTLEELGRSLQGRASELGLTVSLFQSDIEGELVSAVNGASDTASGLVINPAGYSHYSVAITDAMAAFRGPVAEVHISQVMSREPFRRQLLTATAADVLIAGAGTTGYLHALSILKEILDGY